jgi:predicted phosphate transport protein (TIGR00153 family)
VSLAAHVSKLIKPRELGFYDLFEEAAANIVRASVMLEDMLGSWPQKRELAREILLAEQEGDRITHDIIYKLHQTFVTPIDREDILALASGLDDILDYTEEVADFLGLYRIEATMDPAVALAKVLHEACRQIAEALPRLRTLQDLTHYVVEIHRLENEGDRIEREALASLFERAIDPMVVIRWKDIIERLEAAVDSTERVANILQGVILKNS